MRRIATQVLVVSLLTLGFAAWPGLARGDVAVSLEVQVIPDSQAGLYQYYFTLILDDPAGTWVPGQGYGGIVFGDVPSSDAPSPIEDFVLHPSVASIGPWSGLGLASGFHNGPTLIPEIDANLDPVIWTPAFVGDSLTWVGTSSYSNVLCNLTFSTLFTTNGADPAEFAAVRCVPEPGPLTLALAALPLALASRFRASRRQARRQRERTAISH